MQKYFMNSTIVVFHCVKFAITSYGEGGDFVLILDTISSFIKYFVRLIRMKFISLFGDVMYNFINLLYLLLCKFSFEQI